MDLWMELSSAGRGSDLLTRAPSSETFEVAQKQRELKSRLASSICAPLKRHWSGLFAYREAVGAAHELDDDVQVGGHGLKAREGSDLGDLND
jgi:hypothetical protein